MRALPPLHPLQNWLQGSKVARLHNSCIHSVASHSWCQITPLTQSCITSFTPHPELLAPEDRMWPPQNALTTGLPAISDTISHRRNAFFGHVARLPDDVPAHKALNCHINLSLSRPPCSQWRRRPGRLRSRWVDHAVNRGHRA